MFNRIPKTELKRLIPTKMLELGSENYSKPNFTNITLFHFSQNLFTQHYVIVSQNIHRSHR